MADIQKPMTVMQAEFIQNLIALVNSSGLPFFVVESAIKDILDSVKAAAQKQLEQDMREYGNALKAAGESEEDRTHGKT